MNLDELPGLLAQLQQQDKAGESYKALFAEIHTALADVLEHLETNSSKADALADKLVAAIRAIRIDVPAAPTLPEQKAPVVTVNTPKVTVAVSPTPVSVNVPEIKPVVHVIEREQQAPAGWDIEHIYSSGGIITRSRVTRIDSRKPERN